jgi:outer membrane lipoprotein SlyB
MLQTNIAGGVTGALIGMGIPEYETNRYEGKVKDGNILLSVQTEDSKERDRAKKILEAGGAVDVSYTGEASVPKEQQPAAH